jgi:L-alanine-DL-glutamate epimerase-like enolase superfamily enzyme
MPEISMEIRSWPLREPFRIARTSYTTFSALSVNLTAEDGLIARGESSPVDYAGETPETMRDQIRAVREDIESGIARDALINLLPAGGARFALDTMLWDLEAKRSGLSPFDSVGVTAAPVPTAYTIGMRSLDEYESTARAYSRYPLLKVKIGAGDPVGAIEAVRSGAPDVPLIVDPNQAWSVPMLRSYASDLARLGVVLLEQPIPVGHEDQLDGWQSPIPLCADELVNGVSDLKKARGRFSAINIKLEKAGGLTAALTLADEARKGGFDLMVGTMGGSSLSTAPALVLAQQCKFVDLDGPLLLSEDWPDGLVYRDGIITPPSPVFWG